jgi:hypothetical protein
MSAPSEQVTEGRDGSGKRSRGWLIVSAVAVLLLFLVGVAAYLIVDRSDPLANDPAGAQACHRLADWIKGDLKDPATSAPLTKAITANVLAQDAYNSTTPAIRAAAGADLMDDPIIGQLKANGGPQTLRLADLPKLHAACVGVGEKMPAYAEPKG